MNSQNNNNGLLWAAAGFTAFLAARALYRNSNKYSFSNKTVLITGASRGLGLVLARQLAAEGAKLAICARDADELETARREFAGMGAEVMTITCDVTDRNQVHDMISSIRERFGGIDVLINNAGVIQVGPMESMTLHEYEETMKTHFWAALYTMLAVIPHMKEQGAGRIINISSVGGKISLPHLVPYSASKFALVGLSEGMHAELKKDGIVVTTVCPGLTRTGSPRNVIVKGQHEKEYAWFKTADSLPFMTMDAEQTAHKILEASRQGDAELITTLSGKFITAFHGFFPGATSELLGVINKILPSAGGIGSTERKKGYESESSKSETIATALTDKAAQKNNQMGASR